MALLLLRLRLALALELNSARAGALNWPTAVESGITQNGGREMKLVPGVRSLRGVAQTSQSRHGNQSTRNPRRSELSRNQLSGFAVPVCVRECVCGGVWLMLLLLLLLTNGSRFTSML